MPKLKIIKRKTKKPVIIAMVGLVGSGKSSVARELAPLIGAAVIEGDAIHIELRKQGKRYEGARKIAENSAIEVIRKGGNVILDSDYIDAKKRVSIREKAKKIGAKVVFIRAYCDYDVMAGRILEEKFKNSIDDFFGGASSQWRGGNKGAIVKLRESWRRTPQHYRWENKVGGRWILKKLPFKTLEVDTTGEWKSNLKKTARMLV